MSRLPAARCVVDDAPFTLEFGGTLPRLEIAYESWGDLAAARDNVVLLCPAFSAHSHARSSTEDETPGWWEKMIGPGRALDTERFHVICPSLLGSAFGTTGPTTVDPETETLYSGRFPVVSIRDIADVHVRLLDALGIERVHAVVGGSMGGMQALELGLTSGERIARVIALSATDRTRPGTAAIRHLGRLAIMSDSEYRGGLYEGLGPVAGLQLARQIGTVFYRSKQEFNDRFRWEPITTPSLDGATFDVQSYLLHQGKKIIGTLDANCYLRLSLAMDLHDLYRGRDGLPAGGDPSPAFFVGGVHEDRLLPIAEQQGLFRAIRKAGYLTRWWEMSSPVGHDAFLVEADAVSRAVSQFLA